MKVKFKYGDKVRLTSGFYEGMEGILDSVLYSSEKSFELYCVEPIKDESDIKGIIDIELKNNIERGIMMTMDMLNKQKPFYVKGEDLEVI